MPNLTNPAQIKAANRRFRAVTGIKRALDLFRRGA
jgi:hypothetical protein